ncbi:hypothetical protein ACLKA7_015041 [Drosophila subpalustris]
MKGSGCSGCRRVDKQTAALSDAQDRQGATMRRERESGERGASKDSSRRLCVDNVLAGIVERFHPAPLSRRLLLNPTTVNSPQSEISSPHFPATATATAIAEITVALAKTTANAVNSFCSSQLELFPWPYLSSTL